MKARMLIGAASSGSGKTTLTLGLLRALRNRGLRVRPFKCGPDYIDTRHHALAAGVPSVNLDLFMMSEPHLRDLFRRYSADKDVAVAEGVMGLFDGYDADRGSSAEIAARLGLPVVLVVNARSVAYSVAPLIYGFSRFRAGVNVVGAIFNFVASESHYAYLKEACRDAGVEPLGYLPRQADIEIPGRHLGLTLEGESAFEPFADKVAALVEQHVAIDRLLELTASPGEAVPAEEPLPAGTLPAGLRIAVARDAAFNFYYEENLRLLARLGTVRFFSPLADSRLPEADFIYLPGGYPELRLAELSGNEPMRRALRDYVERGGKMLAECGGMMYLCERIVGMDGKAYPMVGALPRAATMSGMKLRLGYRRLACGDDTLWGHEFHYSRLEPDERPLPSVAEAFTAKGIPVDTPLYRHKNLLAGYTHLYWGDPARNGWFLRFIASGVPGCSR